MDKHSPKILTSKVQATSMYTWQCPLSRHTQLIAGRGILHFSRSASENSGQSVPLNTIQCSMLLAVTYTNMKMASSQ